MRPPSLPGGGGGGGVDGMWGEAVHLSPGARARLARERKGDRQLQRGQGRGAGEGEREGGETLWTEGGRGAVCDSADDDGAGEGEALHGDRGGDPWPAALQEARNKQHARREAPHASLIRVVHEVHDPYPGPPLSGHDPLFY